MTESIIGYYGEQVSSKCGYCKGRNCSRTYGMNGYRLTPQDYQDLIDRGWRRSGNYCYKPDNRTTCCPCYTIRCDVEEFKLSKSHKKILKRMNRFLRDGVREGTSDKGEDVKDSLNVDLDAGGEGAVTDDYDSEYDDPEIPDRPLYKLEDLSKVKSARANEPAETSTSTSAGDNTETETTPNVSPASTKSDNSRPPLKKAKQMRLERYQAKLTAKGGANVAMAAKKNKTTEKTITDFVNEAKPETDKHKLKIVWVASNTEQAFTDASYMLYCKYQIAIHDDKPEYLTPTGMQRFLHRTPLKLKLVKVSSLEFLETQQQEYKLYQKYQLKVHNDVVRTVESFLSFLHTSPIEVCESADGPDLGYNSYHQQYWLDDKLIAVGVLDLLPYCLSSVYFFYDPDYKFLTLGTYGSLREIEFVQQHAASSPQFKYYYMGFYIHSCPKMRYKGKISGSYLLCPETYTWHLLSDAIRAKLDECKYQRLNADASVVDANAPSDRDVGAVELLLFTSNRRVYYRDYRKTARCEPGAQKEITEFAQLVGCVCAKRLIYVME